VSQTTRLFGERRAERLGEEETGRRGDWEKRRGGDFDPPASLREALRAGTRRQGVTPSWRQGTTSLQARLREDGARVCRRPLAWVLEDCGDGGRQRDHAFAGAATGRRSLILLVLDSSAPPSPRSSARPFEDEFEDDAVAPWFDGARVCRRPLAWVLEGGEESKRRVG
jgi:hypothetical protein